MNYDYIFKLDYRFGFGFGLRLGLGFGLMGKDLNGNGLWVIFGL